MAVQETDRRTSPLRRVDWKKPRWTRPLASSMISLVSISPAHFHLYSLCFTSATCAVPVRHCRNNSSRNIQASVVEQPFSRRIRSEW